MKKDPMRKSTKVLIAAYIAAWFVPAAIIYGNLQTGAMGTLIAWLGGIWAVIHAGGLLIYGVGLREDKK